MIAELASRINRSHRHTGDIKHVFEDEPKLVERENSLAEHVMTASGVNHTIYRRNSEGSGALLFLPGNGSNVGDGAGAAIFAGIADENRDTMMIGTRPDHYASDTRQLASDYLSILDKLNIEKIGIVAVSMNTFVAVEMAKMAKDRISDIVTVGSPTRNTRSEYAWAVRSLLPSRQSVLSKTRDLPTRLFKSHEDSTERVHEKPHPVRWASAKIHGGLQYYAGLGVIFNNHYEQFADLIPESTPWFNIVGANDQFADPSVHRTTTSRRAIHAPQSVKHFEVEGADHFWQQHAPWLGSLIHEVRHGSVDISNRLKVGEPIRSIGAVAANPYMDQNPGSFAGAA